VVLVKIKADKEFHGRGQSNYEHLKKIKEYLAISPVLIPPQQDRPFYIYLSVGDISIASVVVKYMMARKMLCFTSAKEC
jgi:hypothetical protein